MIRIHHRLRNPGPLLALACFALFLAGGLNAQSSSFEDETTVVVVEVPVNVHRDGEPVRGLTREDFIIREGRKQWPLVAFEVVDLEARAATAPGRTAPVSPPVPIAARRHFLLLFDLTAGGLAGLEGARDLIRSGLHATDLVGVGVYGRSGANLLGSFTSDHQRVLSVLDTLGGAKKDDEESSAASARQDPLGLMPDTRPVDIAAEELAADGGGRGSNADLLFDMNRENVDHGRNRARSELTRFSDSLGALADATARLDGRKFLVLFSAGFDDELFFESEILSRRSMLDSRQGAVSMRVLQRMTERFRRAGWSIQSVDAAGLQAGRLSGGTSLSMLARETGGETYHGYNDLSGAMDQMLGKTEVTYLLAFQADGVRIDGAFHEIEVSLKDGPRGARLIHRPGYYAPDPKGEEGDIGGLAGNLSVAEMLLSGETSGELEVETQLSNFRGDVSQTGDASRTAAWIHIAGDQILAATDASPPAKMELELYAYVLDPNGGVADFFTRKLSIEREKVQERLRAGLRLYTDFDLPPGSYDLRLLARELGSGLHALRRIPFDVQRWQEGDSALIAPFLIDPPGALVIRERPPAGEADDYPFIAGEAELFVPAIDPILGAGTETRVCLMGYHLARPGLLLDAAVYDVTSGESELLGQDRVSLVGRSETGDHGLDRLYLSLRTDGMAEGSYELLVSIRDPETGFEQAVASPFRIDAGYPKESQELVGR